MVKTKQKRNYTKFKKIVEDIKKIKIQGARNIAKSALYAYSLFPTNQAKKQLEKARPTEPMLVNILHNFEELGYEQTLQHFDAAQNKINKNILRLIKNNSVIFTHCHSSNVIQALIYAKKKGKKFEVYNTETRPLFQGRKTAKDLKKAGIKVTTFVDAAARVALTKSQGTRKVSVIFFGSDAILREGIINKIGSGMFAEIAKDHKIPVYIIADSWKYTDKVKLEQRNFKEVWDKAPKNIKVKNLAFEKVEKKYIKAIVSELGVLTLAQFLKKREEK